MLQIPEENLLDDVQVLTRSGKLESGANAYLYVSRRIWWAWPFYAIFRLPGLNGVLWWGYRWFNRNRYRISRHRPLPQPQPSGDERVKNVLRRFLAPAAASRETGGASFRGQPRRLSPHKFQCSAHF
jgi:hypothetical protein